MERICLQCKRPKFNNWVRKIPWRKAQQPTPVFLPGESYGQRSLAGYSHGFTESYMTEATAFKHMEFMHLYLELMGGEETGTSSLVPTFPLVRCTGPRRRTNTGPLCCRLTWESPWEIFHLFISGFQIIIYWPVKISICHQKADDLLRGERYIHPKLCYCCSIAKSCPTLVTPCDPSVHGIPQARILEWVAFSFSRGSSWPRDWTCMSYISRRYSWLQSHQERTPKTYNGAP